MFLLQDTFKHVQALSRAKFAVSVSSQQGSWPCQPKSHMVTESIQGMKHMIKIDKDYESM